MEENQIQTKPYYCPNCRSNRVKFNVVTTYTQSFMKDAQTGMISTTDDPMPVSQKEPDIQCRVCGFIGNEQRFIRQAERDPRG